jgi:hypothetical protein
MPFERQQPLVDGRNKAEGGCCQSLGVRPASGGLTHEASLGYEAIEWCSSSVMAPLRSEGIQAITLTESDPSHVLSLSQSPYRPC